MTIKSLNHTTDVHHPNIFLRCLALKHWSCLWLIPSLLKVIQYKMQFCILFATSFKIWELKWNLKSMNGTYRKAQIFGCHFVKSCHNMDVRFCTCRVDRCCHQTQRTCQIRKNSCSFFNSMHFSNCYADTKLVLKCFVLNYIHHS